MTIEERDEAIRRKLEWPTVAEQKAYWETNQLTLSAISRTLENLTKAVDGLLFICQDQQKQIDSLRK